ncbi:MAG: low specificity L-threonine aldolase [Deferribacterales bacterium]
MNTLFISDNTSPADHRIIKAISDANEGYALSYGNDKWTEEAETLFKKEFGENSLYFPVLTGTGANITALASVLKPFQSVLCASTAHINVDECGAPERFTGSKIIPIETENGKLTPEMLSKYTLNPGFEHHSQPGVISISQTTETGTAYSEIEILELSDFAKKHNMILHIDGSRIANAAAFLGVSLGEACRGADVLSFGGTKNGLVLGEAVVFLNPALAAETKYHRKQFGQLYSKMRYLSAQFIPYLRDEIWHENASKANRAASMLADGLMKKNINIHYPVNGNAVFAVIPPDIIEKLSKKFRFYVWDESASLCRFMCPYTTTAQDIEELLNSF